MNPTSNIAERSPKALFFGLILSATWLVGLLTLAVVHAAEERPTAALGVEALARRTHIRERDEKRRERERDGREDPERGAREPARAGGGEPGRLGRLDPVVRTGRPADRQFVN